MVEALIDRLIDLNIGIELLGQDQLKIHTDINKIPVDLLSEIKNRKSDLVDYLKKYNPAEDFNKIPQVEQSESYVLSSSQKRLWVLSQFEESSIAYHIPGVHVFTGELDIESLKFSFYDLVQRHEILRTVFKLDQCGEVRQYINLPGNVKFETGQYDLREKENQDVVLSEMIKAGVASPFNLAEGPLLRADLYQLEEKKWVLAYVMHHIISDGWSMDILVRELLLLYNARISNMAYPLPALRLQYKDYAAWQQSQLTGKFLSDYQEYWLRQFEGELPILELFPDKPRPAIKTFNGASVRTTIDITTSRDLNIFCERHGSTLFMGLLTLVNALLYRYTGQKDFIIGTPIAGREHADLEGQIGFYVNTLALRTRLAGDPCYRELLETVKRVSLSAYERQSYPLDELIDQLNLGRDLSRNALFDVMMVVQKKEGNRSRGANNIFGETTVSNYEEDVNVVAKVDLFFSFAETDEGLQLNIDYNSDIYYGETVSRLAFHLERLLKMALTYPDTPIGQLDYMTGEERRQILVEFNNTSVDYPKDKTLVDLWEIQALKNPDRIALVFSDQFFTWHELNEGANRLSRYLKEKYSLLPNDLVTVCLGRSERMILAILGVLKAGAAYVPIDPEYPTERIDYVRKESGCKAFIDEQELENFNIQAHRFEKSNPLTVNLPTDLAYVIYTSGSTGRPKGCMLEHRGVVNRIEWMWKQYRFSKDDIILQKTAFTFDVSVWELFMPLCWGAKMVLCQWEDVISPQRILSLIKEQQVTCLHFVPGMLNTFIATALESNDAGYNLKSLRNVITSGEALTVETVRKWYDKVNIPVYNLYGPTEASIDVTYYDTSRDDTKIPIGRPVWNTRIYITDERDQLVPVGVAGEISIGGDGLARGYLNEPELTTAKFKPDPFKQEERIYKTGDIGRWLPDGNIEFIGRRDEQVKIRGFRIELGEIENELQAYPSIESVVVLVRQADSEKEMIAYIVSRGKMNVRDLRTYLGTRLPAYMIPAYFVKVNEMPLTPSGKINRKALQHNEDRALLTVMEYVAPGNKTEEKLAMIWKEVLRKERVGVRDDFFEAGGSSLKAMIVIKRMMDETGFSLPIRILFEKRNIENLADYIIRENRSTSIAAQASNTTDGGSYAGYFL